LRRRHVDGCLNARKDGEARGDDGADGTSAPALPSLRAPGFPISAPVSPSSPTPPSANAPYMRRRRTAWPTTLTAFRQKSADSGSR